MEGDPATDVADRDTRRIGRLGWAAAGLTIVLLAVLATLWLQRRPIARGFVDRELAKAGVPARYTVADIGFSRQRLRDVVIGDPANPDLVADWVDVSTSVGFGGARVTGVAAGTVRLRARLVGGKLSLGAIDRLLPAPSGKPFALPAIDGRFDDVRVRLETGLGIAGIKLSGAGRLDDGFVGRLALVSARLGTDGCSVDQPAAALAMRISGARPTVEGPVRVGRIACGGVRAETLMADVAVTLGEALDRWTGRTRLTVAAADHALVAARQLIGRASFAGDARSTTGDLSLKAAALDTADAGATAAGVEGRYRAGTAGFAFNGRVSADRVALRQAMLERAAVVGKAGAGTPLGPILRRLGSAAATAGQSFALDGAVEAVAEAGGAAVRLTRVAARSVSGAQVSIAGTPLRFGSVEIGSRIAVSGGGLPDAQIALSRAKDGIEGRAIVAPYAAGNARLSLTPVTFRGIGGGVTRIVTNALLTGPLADGLVQQLAVPIDARWRGGALALNAGCAPVAWQAVRVSTLALGSGRLQLCAVDGGWVTLAGGRVGGGVRTGSVRLRGTLGGSPVEVAARSAQFRLGSPAFDIAGLSATLGPAGSSTRLDADALIGRLMHGGAAGGFSGASGRIGNVPLLLSDANGTWSFQDGKLALGGAMRVADAATDTPRFKPLAARDVVLTLTDGRISARGVLQGPVSGTRVADVTIDHLLSSGSGHAHLEVPGVAFAPGKLQPDDLTPITFGVIAEVAGTVSGAGDIAWSRDGVASKGVFRTSGTDLAAAFGPVTGLSGEIVFTDLLGLVSAPGQVATIASVNPGIPVENGTVRYQLVGNNRVAVAGGRWPFAGGTLTLDPTTLDFNADQARRMTFNVSGVDAAAFLQQFDFDNLNATGIFDGVLPMTFDQSGGRIDGGHLSARGGGSLAYIGTVTEKDVGFWGNLAFQALKALDYRHLDVTPNGPLAGEMVTQVRFAGVSQGKGTKSNFLIRRLAKLPFVFNVTVRAPFRQLVDSVRSYYDPSRLIQRNLPALMEQQRAVPPPPAPPPKPAIQPSESEIKP